MLEAGGLRRCLPQFRLLPRGVLAWLGGLAEAASGRARRRAGRRSALLPCGFLYGFALAAAATGKRRTRSGRDGGRSGSANLPALLGFVSCSAAALVKLRRHLPCSARPRSWARRGSRSAIVSTCPAFAVQSVLGASSKPKRWRCPWPLTAPAIESTTREWRRPVQAVPTLRPARAQVKLRSLRVARHSRRPEQQSAGVLLRRLSLGLRHRPRFGLGSYYEYRDPAAGRACRCGRLDANIRSSDDAAFLAANCATNENGQRSVELLLGGRTLLGVRVAGREAGARRTGVVSSRLTFRATSSL